MVRRPERGRRPGLLGVEVGDHVQAGEARLQEVLLVALHLEGPEPLGDGAAGRQGRGDALVQQGLGRTDRRGTGRDSCQSHWKLRPPPSM